MHSWPFYSCCLRGWRSSICGTSSRRLQRRHKEENDDEEAQEVPGNSISPRANTFPPDCLLCYILARRMGGLLKRLVVTFEHCRMPFFFFYFCRRGGFLQNLHACLRTTVRIPAREMIFAGSISRDSAYIFFSFIWTFKFFSRFYNLLIGYFVAHKIYFFIYSNF